MTSVSSLSWWNMVHRSPVQLTVLHSHVEACRALVPVSTVQTWCCPSAPRGQQHLCPFFSILPQLPLCWTAFLGSLRMFIPFSHSKRNFPVVTISYLLCWPVFPWFVRQNIDEFHLENRVHIVFAESRLFLKIWYQMPICHVTCFGQHLFHFPLGVIWKRRAKHDVWSCVHGVDDCWYEYYDSGKGLGSRQLRTRGLQNSPPFQPSDK